MFVSSTKVVITKNKPISAARVHKAFLSLYAKPPFYNQDAQDYEKGSIERTKILQAVKDLKAKLPVKVPTIIGGREILSPASWTQINPANHKQVVAGFVPASKTDVKAAIESALEAKPEWESMSLNERASIFLRAAELCTGKYRYELMAATMVGQGKNIWQAEIDAAAETADLLRYYVTAAFELVSQQPHIQLPGMWNRMDYRALEGFVYAISPFNFTALGATLAAAPALMGNVVVWKPSLSSYYASWLLHKILLEAGLPRDVIQFIPGDAELVTDAVLEHPAFSGLNFTGSTQVFKSLWGKIGKAVAEDRFLNYPRVVGETGGKNFHIIHGSADMTNAVNSTIRGAFEYQGQKCSATSRIYVAESVWPAFKESLVSHTSSIKVGDPEQVENFVNPVIHEASFDKLNNVIENAKTDPKLTLLVGGKASKETGFYVHPTIYQTSDPYHELMSRELFGPITMVYVYPDSEYVEILKTVDGTAKYALTGSIFAQDQAAINLAESTLRNSAGNFYINTKSTGSVVGQQPFGGSRGSGTNDKVGSVNALMRFVSVRSIKEDLVGTKEFLYPSNLV